jgi:hypothetical protein
MEFVAPIALFLFFLGVMYIQGRRRGNPYGELGGPTADQKRVARGFQAVMIGGWVLLMVALIGPDEALPLLAPAGAIFFAGGLAFQLDYRGLRDALTRVDAQSASTRIFGVRNVTPLWGVLGMLIGLGFLAGGIAAALT